MFYVKKQTEETESKWFDLVEGETIKEVDVFRGDGTAKVKTITERYTVFENSKGSMSFMTDTGHLYGIGVCTGEHGKYFRYNTKRPQVFDTRLVTKVEEVELKVGDKLRDGRFEVVYQNSEEMWLIDHDYYGYDEMMYVGCDSPDTLRDPLGDWAHKIPEICFK